MASWHTGRDGRQLGAFSRPQNCPSSFLFCYN
nr:MAG TPA: hypothetical protein [Caudoviricetes sp.]